MPRLTSTLHTSFNLPEIDPVCSLVPSGGSTTQEYNGVATANDRYTPDFTTTALTITPVVSIDDPEGVRSTENALIGANNTAIGTWSIIEDGVEGDLDTTDFTISTDAATRYELAVKRNAKNKSHFTLHFKGYYRCPFSGKTSNFEQFITIRCHDATTERAKLEIDQPRTRRYNPLRDNYTEYAVKAAISIGTKALDPAKGECGFIWEIFDKSTKTYRAIDDIADFEVELSKTLLTGKTIGSTNPDDYYSASCKVRSKIVRELRLRVRGWYMVDGQKFTSDEVPGLTAEHTHVRYVAIIGGTAFGVCPGISPTVSTIHPRVVLRDVHGDIPNDRVDAEIDISWGMVKSVASGAIGNTTKVGSGRNPAISINGKMDNIFGGDLVIDHNDRGPLKGLTDSSGKLLTLNGAILVAK